MIQQDSTQQTRERFPLHDDVSSPFLLRGNRKDFTFSIHHCVYVVVGMALPVRTRSHDATTDDRWQSKPSTFLVKLKSLFANDEQKKDIFKEDQ
jgi:hypothetical protein